MESEVERLTVTSLAALCVVYPVRNSLQSFKQECEMIRFTVEEDDLGSSVFIMVFVKGAKNRMILAFLL